MSKQYLLIRHLQIHNANAMSSPYTVGFPAMTAWLGAIHALERKIHQQGMDIDLQGLAVSCHQCNVQLYRGPHDYYNSIIGTANPLKKSKKTGEFERPPFIEEARCHLDVTLLMEITGADPDETADFLQLIRNTLSCLKIAGGDIVSNVASVSMKVLFPDEEDEKDFWHIIDSLMPGYILLERTDLMQTSKNEDALDALLHGVDVVQISEKDENGKVIRWQAKKEIQDGWLVPITVGFKDLSGAKTVINQRSTDYEHHFVEPVVTLGEFVMPYRLFLRTGEKRVKKTIDKIIWRYHYDAGQGLYLCEINTNK